MADVEYRRVGRVAYITFNRPEKHNALTDDGVRELSQRLYEYDGDDDAFVAILSGAGPSFCSGADTNARLLDSAEAGIESHYRPEFETAFQHSVNWKPVISAVHGFVMGKGLSACLYSDLVIASADTRFQLTEVNINIAAGLYWALVAYRASETLANDVAMTGRFWDASEALAHSMVNKVASAGAHLEAAEEMAEMIAGKPPMAVRATVQMRRRLLSEYVQRVDNLTPHYRWDLTEDFRESVAAKIEKREPRFTGR